MFYRHKSDRASGFSLVEAILASFLLLTAVALAVFVFDNSLQAEAGNEKRVTASLVAECALAQMRQEANTNLAAVKSTYNNATRTVPEYPDFTITSKVRSETLAVPCTVLEENQYDKTAVYPAPEGRFMNDSALRAELTISWDDKGAQSVKVSEVLANFSPAASFKIDLLLPDGSVAKDTDIVTVAKKGEAEFSVRALSGGQKINDVTFTWFVEAVDGFGSLEIVSRDTSHCTYINEYRNYKAEKKYSPGLCFLVVRATYQGLDSEARVKIKNAS